jgi:hypothetical protein
MAFTRVDTKFRDTKFRTKNLFRISRNFYFISRIGRLRNSAEYGIFCGSDFMYFYGIPRRFPLFNSAEICLIPRKSLFFVYGIYFMEFCINLLK